MSGFHPGSGQGEPAGQAHDLSSLQESFSQQQAKITALRELVRQTESAHGKKTASAQEKVKNIAHRLTQYKTKAAKSRLSRAGSYEAQDLMTTRINEEGDTSFDSYNVSGVEYEEQQHMSLPPMSVTRARSETPGSEKINLLRQQMEQNRLKMAERESHKREMEEKVIELKHKLESTQQTLERSAEFGRSTGDLTLLAPMKMGRFEFNKSTSDLTQLATGVGYSACSNFDLERLKYLEGRVKQLEGELVNKENIPVKDDVVKGLEAKILDLEEALKEKESVIEARTQAVTLMTENLSMKGKNTVDLLEDTKQEMYRMQTNFVQAESNMKAQQDQLQIELDDKSSKISNLEEMNNILETARYDLTVENAALKQKLEDVQDFSTKISELNKLNQSLQHRITELEGQKYDFITDAEAEQAKFGENDERYRELLDRIHELEEELTKKTVPKDDLLEKIRSLNATVEAQNEQIESYKQQIVEFQENLQEKTVELSVLNANFSVLQEKLKNAGPKPLFPRSAEEETEGETTKLKQQLDEANKSMIKSKVKIKQLQKQVDSFKKTSAVHEEVVRLTEEVQTLTQRLAEAEEEKGNLQLHLVHYDGSLPQSELEKRIKILETTCQNQTTAIQLLEEQKSDINEDLNSTKHELEAMRDQVKELNQSEHSGRISCQMSSIEFEEKWEKCVTEREELSAQLKKLTEEKVELQQKLDRYMVENIELLDKIEKLSLEKVSSAESIEIVEGLTQKEKQEIESFEQKQAERRDEGVDEVDRDLQKDDGNRSGPEPTEPSEEDLSASLVKLRQESSELMHKIELFTDERREVLAKWEALKIENQTHIGQLGQLRDEHQALLEKHAALEGAKSELEECLGRAEGEKQQLARELEAAKVLSQSLEVEGAPKSSPASPTKTVATAIDKDTFEQALRSVDNEVTNYNKNKDKHKKLQISKKLSSDAKNLQTLSLGLLEEYYRNVEECGTMKGEMERLKQKVHSLSVGDGVTEVGREVSILKAQIMELTHAQIDKVEQIEELREELERRNESLAELKREMEAAREAEKSSDDEPELLKVELNSRNDEIRELKKELETLADRKTAEIEEIQSRLSTTGKEIQILKELVAEQKQQLIDTYQEHENEIAAKLKEIQNYENEVCKLKDEIEMLNKRATEDVERHSRDMTEQLEQLKSIVEEQKDVLGNKQETIETLNSQLIEVYRTMEENANKTVEKEDEVQYLQELLEAKKDEIQKLHEQLAENSRINVRLEKQLKEALAKPKAPSVDEEKHKQLEEKNRELDSKNKELLEKLKKFAANLKKKNAQCQELEGKLAESVQKMGELKKSSSSEEELREENAELGQKMHHLNNELHKLLQLKYTLESGRQVAQHDAAELQERIKSLEGEAQDSLMKLEEMEQQLAERVKEQETIQADLDSKNVKIEKCKAIIKEKNKEIQRLQESERKTTSLENELKMSQCKLEDFHNQTLLLGKLKADKEEINAALRAESERNKALEQQNSRAAEKVRKLEVDLEIADEENKKLKQQIVKLEEGISLVEERRNSLERQKKLLGQKLEETSHEFSMHEDELMQRLANLSQHDEAVEHKLMEKEDELSELGNRLRDVEHHRDQLQSKIDQLETQLSALEDSAKRATEWEHENYSLNQTVSSLQVEVKRILAETSEKLAEKDTEIDQLELELTNQLEKIENERKQLQEDLERTRDVNAELRDEIVRLQENGNSLDQSKSDLEKEVTWLKMQNESLGQDAVDLQELRMQIVQDQTELENLRQQCETLVQNHQCEVNALRQQIADMEAIRTQLSQNQTDDQVIVQNEMIKLKDLLTQRESELASLQLQVSTAEPVGLSDPFANLLEAPSTHLLEEKIQELENDATLKDSRIQELQIEKDLAEGSLEELRKQLHLLQKRIENTEAQEAALTQKGSELEAMSRQLFQTVPPQKQEPAIVSTAQLFSAPEGDSAASLFDSVAGNWGWDEPIVVQQQTKQKVAAALPPLNIEVQDLRAEMESLRSQNESATREIQSLQSNLASLVNLDDEFQQLKDEIDIVRAQNASLKFEVDEKTLKMKLLSQTLLEEQRKVCQLEEQIQSQEVPVVPSVASFFTAATDDNAMPTFEEFIVPKKAYLCTPSLSEDVEEKPVEEAVIASVSASSQYAVPSKEVLDDEQHLRLIEDQAMKLAELTDQYKHQLKHNDQHAAKVNQLEQALNDLRQHNNLLEAQLKAALEQQKELECHKAALEATRLQQTEQDQTLIGQLQQELNQLRKQHAQLEAQLSSTHEQQRVVANRDFQLQTQLEQQQADHRRLHAEIDDKRKQLQTLSLEHQQQQSALKQELDQLRQRNASLEQDRDTLLQLQDELDILRAQNASLLQEQKQQSDKMSRIRHTLTDAEARVVLLEEQLAAAKEQPLTAASFFGTASESSSASPGEVVFEEIIQPKRAFEVQLADEGEDDCWVAEEAMLEAQHQQTSSVALERRISQKDDYIRQLELEKERLQQEITDLKVKSGKLLKKVKEYKAKSETLQRQSASMETSELDLAIQEELNVQLKSLESKLSEVQTERDSLLKRVDVLEAANERFTEMKERQDAQMELQLAKIKELNAELQQLKEWDDDSFKSEKKQATETPQKHAEGDTANWQGRAQELERDIQDLRVDNEELQALLDEEKANVEILEKRVKQKDGEIRELIDKIDGLSQDSRSIKTSLESLNQQKSQETVDLNQKLKELMNRNTELTQQIEKMRRESFFQSSEQEVKLQEQLQLLSAQLQYKEAEIIHLNERIEQQAAEDQTQSLVQEILKKNQEIQTLKVRLQQLEADRKEQENNLTLQITKELAASRSDESQNPNVAELERANRELQEEKRQMEQELQVLNDQVLRSLEFEDRMKGTVLELDTKNIEIEALKASLELMKQSSRSDSGSRRVEDENDLREQIENLIQERTNLEANYRITLDQRDAHWAQVVEERGAQVAENWKQHVDSQEAEFSAIEKSLREEIDRLNSKTTPNIDAPIDSSTVQKMKEALESQELEIVTLKEQLAIRSAEYARLAAQMDPFAVKHAINLFANKPQQSADGDKVPRAEHEKALYTIYQRDMRCEELLLEVRNLLRERDSLQLRLSDVIRQFEDFKQNTSAVTRDASGDTSDASKITTPEKSLQQILQESGIGGAAPGSGASDASQLAIKLSELHTVGHTQDKRRIIMQEEHDEPHRQLPLIQGDPAIIPLGADPSSVNISHSDSSQHQHQQQSASSALFNWILGKKSDS
ncbi:protein lava lamp-like [Toxorhynchites rutilus septentrionalis]|uniref:protein lava lamp-like n=1 Tax=Toxorhynchites rutilus septentrionalis TaxID=329112 RepID=UPI002479A209|nr:protein lava lamp-like [Toxorhynchites rutilus septentrionalis]